MLKISRPPPLPPRRLRRPENIFFGVYPTFCNGWLFGIFFVLVSFASANSFGAESKRTVFLSPVLSYTSAAAMLFLSFVPFLTSEFLTLAVF